MPSLLLYYTVPPSCSPYGSVAFITTLTVGLVLATFVAGVLTGGTCGHWCYTRCARGKLDHMTRQECGCDAVYEEIPPPTTPYEQKHGKAAAAADLSYDAVCGESAGALELSQNVAYATH